MKFLLSIISILIPISAWNQPSNLLPNPDFEAFIECPKKNFLNGFLEEWTSTDFPNNTFSEAARYYNTCNPSLWKWPEITTMENGAIGIIHAVSQDGSYYLPAFIYVKLTDRLIKDSIYYFEYITTSDHWLFENLGQTELPRNDWCASPNLGFTLTVEPPEPDTLNPLIPFSTTREFGYKFEGPLIRFGQCYKATGNEQYFVFGEFQNPYSSRECMFEHNSGQQYIEYGQLLDNFRFEKMIPELCCDTLVCAKDFIDFSYSIGDYVLPNEIEDHFVWNDGIVGLNRSFEISGSYFLYITLSCGSILTSNIHVEVDDCLNNFGIPNAFSPNNDGINDFVKPFHGKIHDMIDYTFNIYDRWGNEVYHSDSIEDQGWNGAHHGGLSIPGVYVWYLTYKMEVGDKIIEEVLSGDVLLVK